MDVSEIIECAAELVDGGEEVSDEYRRGVVELATRLCLPDPGPEAQTVMGYAVCGVNKYTVDMKVTLGEPGVEVNRMGSASVPGVGGLGALERLKGEPGA